MAFFDPARPAYRANPYPSLARLREEAPVHWSPELRAWVLTRHEDCARVLRDSAAFTMDPARTSGPRAEGILAHRSSAPLGRALSLGTTSGEAHRDLRRVVNPVFSPAAAKVRKCEVEAEVRHLLDGMETARPVEFMGAVANPLPRIVMTTVMGLPAEDAERLQGLLTVIEVARSNPVAARSLGARAEVARRELVAYFESFPADAAPADTVVGSLARQRRECEGWAEEMASVAAHIATVGADPTSGAIGNAVVALAQSPEAYAALRCEPALLPAAVQELLRFDSPTHIAPRFAAADVELGTRKVRRGDSLLAMVGAANRDPAVFERPDELDIRRDARRQLGFGQGEHICLGAPLALVILEAVLGAMLARFARVELVRPPEYGVSVELRVPDRVVVELG